MGEAEKGKTTEGGDPDGGLADELDAGTASNIHKDTTDHPQSQISDDTEVERLPDRTVLTEVRGWTPVIDALAAELGLTSAVVYGVVWRHCQLKHRECWASVSRLARLTGVSPRTVQRHLLLLCDAGYLADVTPSGRTHKTRTYADTGKAQIMLLVEARVGLACDTKSQASDTDDAGVTESHPRGDRESPLGVTESHPKRLVKETTEEKEVVVVGSGHGSVGWCEIHNVQMTLWHGKNGASWYSHKLADGSWCTEKSRRKAKSRSEANRDDRDCYKHGMCPGCWRIRPDDLCETCGLCSDCCKCEAT